MGRYDRLIGFLEDEAQALRARITDLADDDYPQGIATSEGDPGRSESGKKQAERKLGEIEAHIRDLRADPGA